ncbi:hypothetical protein FQN49_004056 [Arthroderma sp. PD_2]|nr:hypothetical protein FQN49_004056 [Arthroderma sp. PD_2]
MDYSLPLRPSFRLAPEAMNFAPYQDQSPDIERALSPPLAQANRIHTSSPRQTPSPLGQNHPRNSLSQDRNTTSNAQGLGSGSGFGRDVEGGRMSLGAFETSLPLRMDYEAMLAYLLLPPAGGVFLLLTEHKSDYVRFHAWQSSLLFTFMFVIHMLFAWSSIISWLLFICNLGLIGFLSMHAYRDVDSLEHYQVPFFGPLANSFVDDE